MAGRIEEDELLDEEVDYNEWLNSVRDGAGLDRDGHRLHPHHSMSEMMNEDSDPGTDPFTWSADVHLPPDEWQQFMMSWTKAQDRSVAYIMRRIRDNRLRTLARDAISAKVNHSDPPRARMAQPHTRGALCLVT